MIFSPATTSLKLRPSAILVAKYGSILSKRARDLRKASYLALFLKAASLTMLLKQDLSKANNTQSVLALIDAALGALYSRASSPKDSPGT